MTTELGINKNDDALDLVAMAIGFLASLAFGLVLQIGSLQLILWMLTRLGQ